MKRRVGAPAKKSGQPKAKAAKVVAPIAEDPPSVVVQPQVEIDANGVNGTIYKMIQDAWSAIEGHRVFADMTNELPLTITSTLGKSSGTQAPFRDADYNDAMKSRGAYDCGVNMLWGSLFFNARPHVPLRIQAIEKYMEQRFSDSAPPSQFTGKVVFAMRDGEKALDLKGRLRRISPEEPVYAAVLKVGRGIVNKTIPDDDLKLWRQFFLSVSGRFEKMSDDKIKWAADNLRESAGIDFEAMYPTPIQRIFSIAHHRVWLEVQPGGKDVPSAQDIYKDYATNVNFCKAGRGNSDTFSMNYVQVALTMWDNVLVKPHFRDTLLKAEEDDNHIWDSLYKLEQVVRKVGRSRDEAKTLWLLRAVEFQITYSGVSSADLSINSLSGKRTGGIGILDCELYKFSLLKHLTCDFLVNRSFTLQEKTLAKDVFENHESYVKHYFSGDLTWIGQLSPPCHALFNLIEALVFKGHHVECIRQSCRSQRSESETLDTSPLSDLVELVDSRLETREAEDEPTGPTNTKLAADAPAPDMPFSLAIAALKAADGDKFVEELDAEGGEAVQAAQEKAERQFKEYVAIIPETGTRSEMQVKIEATGIGKLRGSPETGYVMIFFHANLSGESATQPSTRRPSVSPCLPKALFAPLIASRGLEQINDGDMIVCCDGGKSGAEHIILGGLCNPETGKTLPKHKKSIYITKTEESASTHKEITRGTATVNQVEMLHMLTHVAQRTQKKNRVKMDGTTAGTIIGPIGAQACEWITTFDEKKLMYGPDKRPLPGGKVFGAGV